MSDHLIAEANRHAKTLPKMTLPTTKSNDRDLEWYIAECVDIKKQLEMECAAKREHMRIACAEINELKVRTRVLEQELANCAGYIASVRTDRRCNVDGEIYALQTLEWAEGGIKIAEEINEFLESIDAARKEAQP